ncbi:AzlC family ABC transporter permease [Sphaerotilus sp.]|uniref:AzlC family ABC transporter permease n=1 Tax=Sphaerotilus sp. TaxID=2093942 RepID=UPI0038F62F4E
MSCPGTALPPATLIQRLRHVFLHPEGRRGVRDMLPMVPGMAAWGLVTGVAMVKSGLDPWLALLMSLTVFAGSSQLASLPLITTGAPIWVVLLTACIVNLRFVIYSAQWRWYFGHLPRGQRVALSYLAADINYALFVKAWPEPEPRPGQIEYFVSGAVVVWVGWQIPSIVGIVLADAIPPQWGLGFAGTLALIGLTCSLLVDRATWICAAVAALAAVAAFALPYKLHIVVAVAAAVAAGLMMERPGGGGGRLAAAGRRSEP